jgi:hypothetical protein
MGSSCTPELPLCARQGPKSEGRHAAQTVMYFSRTPGTGGAANNGGRMILNEVVQHTLLRARHHT